LRQACKPARRLGWGDGHGRHGSLALTDVPAVPLRLSTRRHGANTRSRVRITPIAHLTRRPPNRHEGSEAALALRNRNAPSVASALQSRARAYVKCVRRMRTKRSSALLWVRRWSRATQSRPIRPSRTRSTERRLRCRRSIGPDSTSEPRRMGAVSLQRNPDRGVRSR
jgi:hypothetical protein